MRNVVSLVEKNVYKLLKKKYLQKVVSIEKNITFAANLIRVWKRGVKVNVTIRLLDIYKINKE